MRLLEDTLERKKLCCICKKELDEFEGHIDSIFRNPTKSFPLPSGGSQIYCDSCFQDRFLLPLEKLGDQIDSEKTEEDLLRNEIPISGEHNEGITILQCLKNTKIKTGRTFLSCILKGSIKRSIFITKENENPYYSHLSTYSYSQIMTMIDELIKRGYITKQVDDNIYPLLTLNSKGNQTLDSGRQISLHTTIAAPAITYTLSDKESRLFDILKIWRTTKAKEEKILPYIVLHDSTLIRIAIAQPTSVANLVLLQGMGKITVEKYGKDILALLTH